MRRKLMVLLAVVSLLVCMPAQAQDSVRNTKDSVELAVADTMAADSAIAAITADLEGMRETEVVDEEAGRDGGTEGVGDHLGHRGDECGEDTECAGAIAQFDELAFGEAATLAPAERTVAGQP